MKSGTQLSDALHVLLHLAQTEAPLTSEALASALSTHAVVLRRLMGGLRERGLVVSEKGHGGGWSLSAPLDRVTLRDVHRALGSPALVSLGFREDHPQCLVAQVVNASLRAAVEQAESALLDRLGDITLAALANEFGHRLETQLTSRSFIAHRLEDHHDQH